MTKGRDDISVIINIDSLLKTINNIIRFTISIRATTIDKSLFVCFTKICLTVSSCAARLTMQIQNKGELISVEGENESSIPIKFKIETISKSPRGPAPCPTAIIMQQFAISVHIVKPLE